MLLSCCPSSASTEPGVIAAAAAITAAADSAKPIRTSLTNGMKTCVDSSSELFKMKFNFKNANKISTNNNSNVLLGFSVSDHGLGDGHLDCASVAGQVSAQSVYHLLDIDFRRGSDCGSGRTAHGVDTSTVDGSRQHLLSRPVQGFSPRVGDEIDVVVSVEGGQVPRQGVVGSTGADPVAAVVIRSGRRPAVGNEGDDVKLEIVLPVGRFAAKLFHVATEDRVDVTIRTHEHHFDGRRWFGAAVATVEKLK